MIFSDHVGGLLPFGCYHMDSSETPPPMGREHMNVSDL